MDYKEARAYIDDAWKYAGDMGLFNTEKFTGETGASGGMTWNYPYRRDKRQGLPWRHTLRRYCSVPDTGWGDMFLLLSILTGNGFRSMKNISVKKILPFIWNS